MKLDLKKGVITWGDKPQKKTFDLLFAGDLCPRGRTEPLILAGRTDEILAEVKPETERADLTVINLETPLTEVDTPIRKSGPNLKVSPACISLLTTGGWDVACCANNHIGDFGPAPVLETLALLAKNGVAAVGAGKDLAAARKPLIVERKGVRVAMLAVAENEFGSAQENQPGANPLQPLRNLRQIRAAAAQADITIVMIHGGNEFHPVPSPRMVDTYRSFAEAGATAVIAGHTHCPQGLEIWQGVPIVYSLSNFLFDSISSSYQAYNWWYGYMVRLGFVGNRAVRLEVIPHHCAPNAEKVTLLKGAEQTKFLEYLQHLSGIIPDEREVARYFDAWCMRDLGYFSWLNKSFYPVDWNNAESVRNLMVRRNLRTCEAHHELVTNTMRILEERREEEAKAYLPRLETLCRGEIPAA